MSRASLKRNSLPKCATPTTNFVIAEYVWIDAVGETRCKSRVFFNTVKKTLADLPNWNFDGSSTGQAPGDDSEVIIIPRAVYPDPFRKTGNHIIVLCDCNDSRLVPIASNTRAIASECFKGSAKQEPWFGIEQEYTLFYKGLPLGWPRSKARTGLGPLVQLGYPGAQGPYYCSAGADVAFGREIVEEHYEACLYAGIKCSGINAEVMPGQWEYQVGPCTGINSGDQLWMSRYLLNRVCEPHGVVCSLLPKPIPGDWNGAGCHTNFSTKKMRQANGLKKAILPAIDALGANHNLHISIYGEGNEARLTGAHETASIKDFSYGVANRGASVRIGNQTSIDGKGYFEDRRPASNMDPYLVTGMIYDTTVNKGAHHDLFQKYVEYKKNPTEDYVVLDEPSTKRGSKKAGKSGKKKKRCSQQ